MKKIISIFLALALFVSCFAGTLTISAEDTAVSESNEMSFGIEIPLTEDYKAAVIEAKNLGSNIIRISEPDDHDYELLLEVIEYAEQHGMEILLNCDHINYEFLYDKEASEEASKIATEEAGETKTVRLPYDTAEEVDTAAVTEHYTTLVNAVNGRVDYYKLGNELDNWYYNAGEQGRIYSEDYYLDVASAAAALGAASEAIKAVDTDAETVINFGWLHYGFLDGLSQNGFSWDITGIDWYSSGSYDKVNGPNGTVNQFDYGHVIDYLATNHSDKKIIICETGLTPNGLDENGDITYIGDAEWLGGMITDIKTNYADKVSAITVFKIYDPVPSTDENGAVIYDAEDYYGIIDSNGNKKDTYYAVQTAFGGSDDWNIISGGDVEDIYDTHYKADAQDCFEAGIRVSDYAETVGSRVLYYPTDTSLNGNLWTLRYGLNDGVNAFEYDGNISDGVYTINAVTTWAGNNGLKYNVAANTELHIPIVVPTDAISILDYYKYEVSFDNGKTWSAITPSVVETRAFKVSTGFNSTMTVYSVHLYKDCDFRVLFPQIWYDETITENSDTPKGRGDSPYDLLYSINVGNVYNAAMYMLPATAYTLPEFSYGCSDVITNNVVDGVHVDDDYVSDLISNAEIYRMDNDTVYAKITGVLGSANTEDTTWRWNSYGTSYASYGERVFVPVYISGNTYAVTKPYIEYFVKAGTIVNFDIGAINKGDFQSFWDEYKIELSSDNGATFSAVDSTNSSYTLNDKSNVRTYTVIVAENSVLRITFPDIIKMSDYIVSKDDSGAYVVNDSRNYLYGEATFVSTLRSADKAVLADGLADNLSETHNTAAAAWSADGLYFITGSDYSSVSTTRGTNSYDFVGAKVVNSSWKWVGITNFETVSIDYDDYVYSPFSSDSETIPYIDFNVAGDTQIIIPIGMYDEMWSECGDGTNEASFTFKFAPMGSDEFTEISEIDYEVISETQQAGTYDGSEKSDGKYNCTIKTYSIAIPENGVLRIIFPATLKKMSETVTKYYNSSTSILYRSGCAFIVPPTAESINYGDINSDGAIDVRDLVRIKKATANVEGLVYDKLAANVDGVSGVQSGDMAVLRQFLIGAIKSFK